METTNVISKEDGSYLYKYFLRGSRTYVQGKIIFDSFYDVLHNRGINDFHVNEIKFQRELYSNGKIFVKAQPDMELVNSEDLCASMSIVSDATPICVYLLADIDSKIEEKKEDIVNPYINDFKIKNQFESDSKLSGIKDFPTLISTMVDVNKRTHIETLNDTDKTYKYVWTFLKNFDVLSDVIFPEELTVNIKHLGHKRNERGEGYTLNRINFSLNEKIYKTDMCYTYVKR